MSTRQKAIVLLTVFLINAALSATYHLDNSASGSVSDGSQANPWQTVEQAQTYLNALPDGGSGDTVLVAAGDSSYGVWADGALGSGFTSAQRQQVPRTDWLVIKAIDSRNPPEFYHLRVYGVRNAYMEFNGLHVFSRAPHRFGEVVHLRNGPRHIRLLNLEMEAEEDSLELPAGVLVTYNSPGNILVENCRLHHLADGFPASGDSLIIRNNEIYDIAGSAVKTSGNQPILVEGNHIHDQNQRIVRIWLHGNHTGTFVKYGPVTQAGTGAKGTVYTVSAEKVEITPVNKLRIQFEAGYAVTSDTGDFAMATVDSISISDRTHGSGLSIRTYQNYTARNNIIHNYGSTAGIRTYPDNVTPRQPFTNLVLENNLVYDAITRTFVIEACGDNVVVRNNTAIGNMELRFFEGYDGSGLALYNNLAPSLSCNDATLYGNINEGNNVLGFLGDAWRKETEFSAGSSTLVLEEAGYGEDYFRDSVFVDYAGKDFRLRAGCPAVDFGDVVNAPATDLNGFDRSGSPDAGCYEYGSTSMIPMTNDKFQMTNVPRIPNPLTAAHLRELGAELHVRTIDGHTVVPAQISHDGIYFIQYDDYTGLRLIVR